MVLLTIFDFLLNINKYLGIFITNYGTLTYLILFGIIFFETGVVLLPFLPGDTLIFGAAVFASQNYINVFILFVIFSVAAILGDTVNYWIGFNVGRRIIRKGVIRKGAIDQTNDFYNKYGDRTIIYARFVPIVRTLAPFFAGMGRMEYHRFFKYNLLGGVGWILIYLISGFFLGKLAIVQKYLAIIIIILIIVASIPPIIEATRIIRLESVERRIKKFISKIKLVEDSSIQSI